MHPEAQTLADHFLSAADAAAPSCLSALYIVGSAALEDFTPGKSDLDFMAVCERPLSDAEGAAIAKAMGRKLDGIFLEPGDLARGPEQMAGPRGVITENGFARTEQSSARNPVAWATLAQCGVAVRGPAIADLDLWCADEAVRAWTRENADRYWRTRWQRGRSLFSPVGLASLRAWDTAWCVLGLARQHYTVKTGKITSKTGAGRYARDVFGARWQPIIEDALAIRAGAPSRMGAFQRRAETRAFMERTIAEILA